FPTRDAPMILAVGNDTQFARFCVVTALHALANDDRYATNPARVTNRKTLCHRIGMRLRQRPREHWLAALTAVGVPCGPVNDLAEVFSDPHVAARGAEIRMPCHWAANGELALLANPLRMSATPPTYRRVPPRLNEHHDEVFDDWLGSR